MRSIPHGQSKCSGTSGNPLTAYHGAIKPDSQGTLGLRQLWGECQYEFNRCVQQERTISDEKCACGTDVIRPGQCPRVTEDTQKDREMHIKTRIFAALSRM